MTDEADVLVKIFIDLSDPAHPTETVVPLSPEEVADYQARAVAAVTEAQQEQAAAAQQQADQQAVIAGLAALGQPDAAAALARLLGVPAP